MNKAKNYIEKKLCKPEIINFSKNHCALSFDLMKAIPAFYIIGNMVNKIKSFKNGKVIESSSGTFALGLAYACRFHNLKLEIISDPICSPALVNQISSLGGVVKLVDCKPDDENVQILRKNELLKRIEDENMFWPQQYSNPQIYESYPHMLNKYVGDEFDFSHITDIVISTGSGGSAMGIKNWIENKYHKKVMIHAVDSHNSMLFGRSVGKRLLRGLGSSIEMPFINENKFNSIFFCNDQLTYTLCSSLHNEYGLFKGVTSGVVFACANYLSKQFPKKCILSILPDQGYRYLDTNYISDPISLSAIDISQLDSYSDTFSSHIGWFNA